jgi:hypothetical protein
MTSEVSQLEAIEERCETHADSESSDEEGDPPDHDLLSARVVPCSVWFGPSGSDSFEREMLGFLGSHSGVAVLQWPRDLRRAAHCGNLGIPVLCFVSDPTEPIPSAQELQEWLPSRAADQEVHDCLWRLSELGGSRREAALLALDSDGLHLGDGEVHLDSSGLELAAALVASFDRPVDDTSLLCVSSRTQEGQRSLFGELLRLDREVNQLGLEVVPVNEHAHLMRRCGR